MSRTLPRYALFPGAGSFGGEFAPLTDTLGRRETRLIKYPGRFGSSFGEHPDTLDEVIESATDQAAALPAPVLVAHSYGAYVAHAVACNLTERGTPPATLIVTGASAPELLSVPPVTSPAEVATYLDDTDPTALATAPSPDWREVVIETTANDLRLLRGLTPPATALTCPVSAIRGSRDELTTDESIALWSNATNGSFTTHTVPGGHSAPLRSTEFPPWVTARCA